MGEEHAENEISCLSCGFEAPADSEVWEVTDHIAMGEIPQCPECDITMTTALGET